MHGKRPVIICVGGGSAEEILKLDEELVVGGKHTVTVKEAFGGSGVNYAMRLINAGFNVFPILEVGKDRLGMNIRNELVKASKLSSSSTFVTSFLSDHDGTAFFDSNIQTSRTTIVLHNRERTIFTQKLRNGEHFIRHIEQRLDQALKLVKRHPSAIMIGHIHSDSRRVNAGAAGECTKFLIERFKDKSLIYANFGKSQIDLGFEFWKEYLPQVDVFQLNHSEAKLFFSHENGEGSSLLELVNAVRKNNMCAVITLDRFGAIGIHRDKPDSVYISRPFLEDKDVRDPTGAGDAFAAGMVAHLCNCKCISANNFQSAMDTACLWAGYACKTYGGAGECPDRKSLENFEESVTPRQQRTVEVVNRDFDREIMTMLDTTSQNGYSTI